MSAHRRWTCSVIGVSAIDEDGSLLDFDHREVQVTKTILAQARTKILVADAMKFNRRAPALVSNLAELDIFITDQTPPQAIVDLCRANEVALHVAGQDASDVGDSA